MIPCNMDPTREARAHGLPPATPALRPPTPIPAAKPTKGKRHCPRCKLLIVGNVSHATADDCLRLTTFRIRMDNEIAVKAKKDRAVALQSAKEWKLKAETANELLKKSQRRERTLASQVDRVCAQMDRSYAMRLQMRAKKAEREVRRMTKEARAVARSVARLNVQVGGMQSSLPV